MSLADDDCTRNVSRTSSFSSTTISRPCWTAMTRKKNLEPVRRRYSLDLKRRVVYQSRVLAKSSTEIAINLDMPLRVVQRVLQRWDEIGDVSMGWRGGRKRLLTPEECEVSILNCMTIRGGHSLFYSALFFNSPSPPLFCVSWI